MAKGGKREGAGRKPGIENKINRQLKETILEALEASHEDGAIGYLKEQAEKNPTAFMTLIGKVLPLQLNHADNEGGKLKLTDILGSIDGRSAGLPEDQGEATGSDVEA